MRKLLVSVAVTLAAMILTVDPAEAGRRGGCGGGSCGGGGCGGGTCYTGGGCGGGACYTGGCATGSCGMVAPVSTGGCASGTCGVPMTTGEAVGGCPGGACAVSLSGQPMTLQTARLIVKVPAHAKLTINGKPTKSTTAMRTFRTPALRPGQKYSYTLKATITQDGEPKTVVRKVQVRAGKTTRVELVPDEVNTVSAE